MKAGGIHLEVDTEKDADRLADHSRGAVGISTRMCRPNHSTPILLLNIQSWVDKEELVQEIIREGVVSNDPKSEGNRVNCHSACRSRTYEGVLN